MESKTKLLIGLSSATICIIFAIFLDYKGDKEMQENYDRLQSALQKELLLNSSCNHHVDSLEYINGELSKFKSLTMAMVHRTDATKDLEYGVGDIVYLKQDSSRAVIEDVLIGGGKYNYFIKYRVLFKDDSRKEVTPEMVY
jgi:uncharacterized protein YktB (UPF0637 family)